MSVVKVTTTLPISWKEFEVGEWAHNFLSEKKVACIQIDRIRSIYQWNQTINSEEEWRLSFTTDSALMPNLIQNIESLHPYDTPQITWNSIDSNEKYSAWVKESVR
ncbi:MAG: divalent cation tolerance protein CutA [Candidatus Thalassarchaeaceae archaeon]|jgi:periplasmic divalent cation tolerance protein|nr:divalent cation tolerance protein CutA [Candidatus Thalassarchaeaceae archaeon]